MKPPWRNGLACWTSNSKVVGSSPTGGEILLLEKILKSSLSGPASSLIEWKDSGEELLRRSGKFSLEVPLASQVQESADSLSRYPV